MNTYVLCIVLAIIIGVAIKAAHDQAKALRKAELEYREALERLGSDSQNNLLRQDALDRGRHFAGLARQKAGSKGVAIFDEVALTNDITARLGSNIAGGNLVPCPECAEQIQPTAKRCRFCGVQFSRFVNA